MACPRYCFGRLCPRRNTETHLLRLCLVSGWPCERERCMKSVSSVSSVDQKLINRMVRIKLFFLPARLSLSSTNGTNFTLHVFRTQSRREHRGCIAALAADGYAERFQPDGQASASDAWNPCHRCNLLTKNPRISVIQWKIKERDKPFINQS